MLRQLLVAGFCVIAAQPVMAGICEDPEFAAYIRQNLASMKLQGGGTIGSYMQAGSDLEMTTVTHEAKRVVCSVRLKAVLGGRNKTILARVTYMETSNGGATVKWDPN